MADLSPTVRPTRIAIQDAIVKLIASIAPAGMEIVEGLPNLVPEPMAADFAVVSIMTLRRLATNESEYTETTRDVLMRTEVATQIDVHGPSSVENAAALVMLIRDMHATTKMAIDEPLVAPLHADDARLIPFENAEQQTEWRWVITASFQANITLTTPIESATEAVITINPPVS